MVSIGLPNAIVTGITTGSILALGAIGVSLIYRIADVPNFAHGELFTWGAYAALLVNLPGVVPVLDRFVGEDGSLGTGGLAFVFLLSAGSILLALYLIGGRRGLEGSWWPRRPDPRVGVAVHVAIAVAVGLVTAVGTPSLWAGFLLAAPLVTIIGLLQEIYVYRRFRNRGADLATLLIVALGLSIFLRNSVIGVFSGNSRSYDVPNIVDVFGNEVLFQAARLFDLYVSASGFVIDMRNTGLPNNPSVATMGYSWGALLGLALVAGVVGLALFRRYADVHGKSGWTHAGVGAGTTLLLGAVVLVRGASVPGSWTYATRIRLSPLRGMIIMTVLVALVVLHLLLQKTKLGTAMRAASDNLQLAEVTGIDTRRTMMMTWVIAGIFGAGGGIMFGLLFNRLVPSMGFFLLLPMFAAVILGGTGSVTGAVVGSFVVGLAEEVGLFVLPGAVPAYRVPIAFALLLVILLVKPEGITGGR